MDGRGAAYPSDTNTVISDYEKEHGSYSQTRTPSFGLLFAWAGPAHWLPLRLLALKLAQVLGSAPSPCHSIRPILSCPHQIEDSRGGRNIGFALITTTQRFPQLARGDSILLRRNVVFI